MMKKYPILTKCIFPVVLLLLPLWNAWVGIDVSDTGYSLAYYRFFPQLDGMWFFSTFLANFVGWLLMHLPGGQFMLGMNLYTSLILSAAALFTYFILSKKVSPVIAFAGEVIAILLCWCPTAILYHYLTYVLFSAGALLLFHGLCSEKKIFLFLAGVLLGINTFVRIPSNCLEVLLIIVVWYAGWLNKKSLKELARQTLLCIAGYLAAAVVCLAGIGLVYGFDSFMDAIMQMIGSTETASDYTLKSMVVTVLKNMQEGFIWLLKLGFVFAAGILIQCIGKKRWVWMKTAACVLLGFGGLFFMMRQGFFDRNYYYHLAVYRPFLVFVWITAGAGVSFLCCKRAEKWEKIWAAMVLAVTVIMPFGTNNHLYANMNNLFLIAPFTLYAVWHLIRYAVAKRNAVCLSASGVLIAFLVVFVLQSFGYGMNFVLFDNYEQIRRDTQTEQIKVLKGVYTTRENAEELEGLYAYLVGAGLEDSELITMGSIPGLHYYFDMPCAVSVLWPDLNTSSCEVFRENLMTVTQEIKQEGRPPVVIVTAGLGQKLMEGTPEGEKETVLHLFLTENGYRNGYLSKQYAVFVK